MYTYVGTRYYDQPGMPVHFCDDNIGASLPRLLLQDFTQFDFAFFSAMQFG